MPCCYCQSDDCPGCHSKGPQQATPTAAALTLSKEDIEIILSWWTFRLHTGDDHDKEEAALAARLSDAK